MISSPIWRDGCEGKSIHLKNQRDISELDGHFYYTPEDGEIRHAHGKYVGQVAGEITTKGYKQVIIGKVFIASHRLAWALHYREWPKQQIDHIDGNPLNNKIENLRDVSPSINSENRRKASKRNKSGLLGVTKKGDKWVSGIVVKGKHIYLGIFSNPIAAHRAYLQAKRIHHEGCTI